MDLFSQIEREFENLHIENLECKFVLQRFHLCFNILMWLIERTLLRALPQGRLTVTGGEPPTLLLWIWNIASISVHIVLQNWCHIASPSQQL